MIATKMGGVGLVLVLTACAPTRTSEPPGAREAVPAGTASVMSEHFAASLEIKDAVIFGDLAGVRTPALRLIEDPAGYPAAWRPYVSTHAELATRARATSDLSEAAHVAATLANTCGECHTATGLGPRFSVGKPPRAASTAEGRRRMMRHQWAADRMWEALVAHDAAAWRAGAAALTGDPLSREALGVGAAVSDATLALQGEIVALGKRAADAATWAARTGLYGEFLAACAGCHARAL